MIYTKIVPTVSPSLSICIATRNRCSYLSDTLDLLLEQTRELDIEIVVVDGASTDGTRELGLSRSAQYPWLKFFPQEMNSGVDGDYDKAVVLARGEFCWLMSDDDVPLDRALERVMALCRDGLAALVLDAEVYSDDLSRKLQDSRLPFRGERRYGPREINALFSECATCLSFIGSLVVRRSFWLGRDRRSYYGTEFVHLGVLFQDDIPGDVLAIGRPHIRIRYGVGGWTSRAFHVWMFKWPELVWSFTNIAESSRRMVSSRAPWRNPIILMFCKTKGWYSWGIFKYHIASLNCPFYYKIPALIMALIPGRILYLALKAITLMQPNKHDLMRWELGVSPYATRK